MRERERAVPDAASHTAVVDKGVRRIVLNNREITRYELLIELHQRNLRKVDM